MHFVETWRGSSEFTAELVRAKLESEGIPVQLLSDGQSDMAPHHSLAPEWTVMVPEDQLERSREIAPAVPATEVSTMSTTNRLVGWVCLAAFVGLPGLIVVIRAIS